MGRRLRLSWLISSRCKRAVALWPFFAQQFLWAARWVTFLVDGSVSTWDGAGHFISSPRPDYCWGFSAFFQRDPRARGIVRPEAQRASREDYLTLFRTPSYVFNCAAQTAMTFAIGGIGFWVAAYLKFRGEPASSTKFFGAIIVVAGLISTLLGGWAGDRLRKTYAGSYFLVSGVGMIVAFPLFVAMLFTPISSRLVTHVRVCVFHVP